MALTFKEMQEDAKALRVCIAELEDDIEELTFCEECGEDCEKTPDNHCYPPRYCHTCQQKLVTEIVELKARLTEAEKNEWLIIRQCTACGELKGVVDPRWRRNQNGWEHLCGDPQAGYFAGRIIGPALVKGEYAHLNEQLNRAIEDGIADTEEEKTRRIEAEARAEAAEKELADAIKAIAVQVKDASEARRQMVIQSRRADSYAKTARDVLRDAGPALVEAREKVAKLEAQLAEANLVINAIREASADKDAKRTELIDMLAEANADRGRLRKALEEIRDGRKPQVCHEYEFCTHEGCQASYAAFAIADIALKNPRKAWRPPDY